MEFSIPDKVLARLAHDRTFTGGHPGRLVEMYRQTLQIVAAVPDESALAAFQCLAYRKVKGRSSARRLALTSDADLLVQIDGGKEKPSMIIERILQNGKKHK